MKITTAVDYGILALVYLARQEPDKVCLISEISRAQGIPEKYLAKIMQSLSKCGMVRSFRGVKGGFSLSLPPEEITIKDALECLQGPLSLHKCVSDPDSCSRSGSCCVRPVWVAGQEKMMEVFESADLMSVLKNAGQCDLGRAS